MHTAQRVLLAERMTETAASVASMVYIPLLGSGEDLF